MISSCRFQVFFFIVSSVNDTDDGMMAYLPSSLRYTTSCPKENNFKLNRSEDKSEKEEWQGNKSMSLINTII